MQEHSTACKQMNKKNSAVKTLMAVADHKLYMDQQYLAVSCTLNIY